MGSAFGARTSQLQASYPVCPPCYRAMSEVLTPSVLERQRPLRAGEFEQMLSSGLFEGERVELIHGRLVLLMSQGPRHVGRTNWIQTLLTERLAEAYGPRQREVMVQVQSSARFAEGSSPEAELTVPEPDLMLVPAPLAFAGGPYQPEDAYLVVEVADTSLAHDLAGKSRVYAALGVPLVWVVDLPNRRLHVLQRPDRDTATYAEASVYEGEETVGIVTLPDLALVQAEELFAHMA